MSSVAAMKDREIQDRLARRGVTVTIEQARTLRRAEMTLQRWGEGECGDSDSYASRAIERDEGTGKPYMVVHPHDGKVRRYPIADRERGALKRVAALCAEVGAFFYHQGDPRGCTLYIAAQPLNRENYSSVGVGVGC